MIFGKHINRYYRKYAGWLIAGLAALILVDYFQLAVPRLYRMVINGMNSGLVMVDGVQTPFDMDFLLDKICMPFVIGAGDADPETGRIGEYAEEWNRRA